MHNRTMVESPAARIGVPQTCPWQTSLSSIQVGPPRPTNPTPLVPNPPRRAILGRRHPRRAILGRRHPLLKLDEDGKKTYFHVIRLSLFFPAFAHCIYIVLKLFFFSTYHACMNVCMYLLAHFLTLSIYRCLSLFFVRVSLFFSLSLSLSLSPWFGHLKKKTLLVLSDSEIDLACKFFFLSLCLCVYFCVCVQNLGALLPNRYAFHKGLIPAK